MRDQPAGHIFNMASEKGNLMSCMLALQGPVVRAHACLATYAGAMHCGHLVCKHLNATHRHPPIAHPTTNMSMSTGTIALNAKAPTGPADVAALGDQLPLHPEPPHSYSNSQTLCRMARAQTDPPHLGLQPMAPPSAPLHSWVPACQRSWARCGAARKQEGKGARGAKEEREVWDCATMRATALMHGPCRRASVMWAFTTLAPGW